LHQLEVFCRRRLALGRARTVVDAMVALGIDAVRLEATASTDPTGPKEVVLEVVDASAP